jgi:hypothetical protein
MSRVAQSGAVKLQAGNSRASVVTSHVVELRNVGMFPVFSRAIVSTPDAIMEPSGKAFILPQRRYRIVNLHCPRCRRA